MGDLNREHVEQILAHFAAKKYSDKALRELEAELHELISSGEVVGDDPLPFEGQPMTGGRMRDEGLAPRRYSNPREGERMRAAPPLAADQAFARRLTERIRVLP
jgi:hypothetical protein